VSAYEALGSLTAIQRFGGNLGLNVHLHALVLDGAFARDAKGALQFHELSGLRQADIARVAARTASGVTALLARRGLVAEDTADGDAQEPDLLATLCAASVSERVALGPKAGWRIHARRCGRAASRGSARAAQRRHAPRRGRRLQRACGRLRPGAATTPRHPSAASARIPGRHPPAFDKRADGSMAAPSFSA
jgi:hypothetical protein